MSKFPAESGARRYRTAGAAFALTAAALLSDVATAAPPANVVGTWTLLADQTYTTLDITNQGAGGPGGSTCRVILGSLGIAPIMGYYCPATGRIHVLHNNLATGATVRTFTGSVTAATASAPAQMAGTFNVVNVAFGPYGEYPFSASK